MKDKTQIWLEGGIYFLIWVVIFAVPLFGYNIDSGIQWAEVKRFWIALLPFFILFMVNNYVLVPFLLFRKRNLMYMLATIVAIVSIFFSIRLLSGRMIYGYSTSGSIEMAIHRDISSFNRQKPPWKMVPDSVRRNSEIEQVRPPYPIPRPMPIRWFPLLVDCLLSFLLVGCNIAFRLFFKSITDSRHLEELERQKLKAELDYLKAQVNPHFFMNTLNNIHALIDINTEDAKETVIKLSKIMRYVLYESDNVYVPLKKEVGFLTNYIELMRIRYPEDIEITTSYPEEIPDVSIPPLLLISLIENAFKHGVGDNPGAYIKSWLTVDSDTLSYVVWNTLRENTKTRLSGVGLTNLSKRLSLLYGDRSIFEYGYKGEVYVAKIIIPVDHEDEMHNNR